MSVSGKKPRLTKVHEHYHEVQVQGASSSSSKSPSKVACNYCKWATSVNATRMSAHLGDACRKCPINIKTQFATSSRTSPVNSESSDIGETSPATSPEPFIVPVPVSSPGSYPTPKRARPQSPFRSIASFCDRMSADQQATCSELVARAIYASSAPLAMIENKHWQRFFNYIRPIWKVPSRYDVSNTLLNAEYNRVKSMVDDHILTAPALGLMCDGWTNVNHQSIVNFVVTTPEPMFYKSLATEAESHTGEYMADIMLKTIEEIGAHKFSGLVTDNAANMKSAWGIVMEKHKHITAYGCVAHGLNLLVTDLVKISSIEQTMKDAKLIVKEIIGSPLLKATFSKIQKYNKAVTSLKLPVQTRWGTHVFLMKSLLDNKKSLKQLAIDDESVKQLSQNAKKLVVSEIFWDKVQNTQNLLKPVVDWITTIESDKPRISSVYGIFSEIQVAFAANAPLAPVTHAEEGSISQKLEKRRKFCVTNLHKAANILDPKIFGEGMEESDKLDAAEFISNMASHLDDVDEMTVFSEFAAYKTKTGSLFSKQFLWAASEKTPALTWWNAFCSGTQLAKLAVRILSLPPTSAACERTFSSYSNVHTIKRNRLTNERAAKIVYVNHNLNLEELLHTAATSTIPSNLSTQTVCQERKSTSPEELEECFLLSDDDDGDIPDVADVTDDELDFN